MPGERVVLLGDSEGRLRSFVTALERFPAEPEWVVVGGFAVNVRVSYAHRLTNDLDTVARSQAELVGALVDTCRARRTSGINDLDPSVNAGGPILSAWGIRLNVDLDRAGASAESA